MQEDVQITSRLHRFTDKRASSALAKPSQMLLRLCMHFVLKGDIFAHPAVLMTCVCVHQCVEMRSVSEAPGSRHQLRSEHFHSEMIFRSQCAVRNAPAFQKAKHFNKRRFVLMASVKALYIMSNSLT